MSRSHSILSLLPRLPTSSSREGNNRSHSLDHGEKLHLPSKIQTAAMENVVSGFCHRPITTPNQTKRGGIYSQLHDLTPFIISQSTINNYKGIIDWQSTLLILWA
ncbi:hypothetical protein P175DRAFT_0529649 [Aspergillus ochraceoroseus IBT 24754]|uniref:Uncharacterized protein n=1 Tax=Aspergillus ochraceoroseus IBT 24754 TaxID=1392256 RepID=A0A2T5M222_9EURO|nr:uncharacterized protein P175DRAFT_0529649 [Aspergillus ochraceoroseus IBT 24754]PTU22582.1 hypothetical protein P175DRAFT_0529649 [Aspergillus ochraceoroseus IBT 24754]